MRVWGPEALFCVPHLRADPYSYDTITPSAAKGILRALYGKPEFEFEIESIAVLRPIRRITTKFRGVPIKDGNSTMQTRTTLVDVDYIIRARIVPNPLRTGVHDTTGRCRSAYEIAQIVRNSLRKGREFKRPCLGQSEFGLSWSFVEAGATTPDPYPITRQMGTMLLDMLPVPGRSQRTVEGKGDHWEPVFFRPEIIGGVIIIPEALYAVHRDRVFAERHQSHEVRMPEGGHHATV